MISRYYVWIHEIATEIYLTQGILSVRSVFIKWLLIKAERIRNRMGQLESKWGASDMPFKTYRLANPEISHNLRSLDLLVC